jgi:hypothetical protein
MTANLRPMNLGEILDRTILIYRKKFLAFAGVAAVPALAVWLAYNAESAWQFYHRHPSSPRLMMNMNLSALLFTAGLYAFGGFFSLLVRPVFVLLASGVVLQRSSSVRAGVAAIRSGFKTLFPLNLVEQVILVIAPAAMFIASLASTVAAVQARGAKDPATWGMVLLLSAVTFSLVGYILWTSGWIGLSFCAAVLEGGSWLAAIRRSWTLSSGGRGRIRLTWLLIFIVAMVADYVLRWTMYLLFWITGARWGFWHGFPIYLAFYSLANMLVSTLIGPIFPIALTLFYYDQRIRREGYDIERMMQDAGLSAPPAPQDANPAGPGAPA